MPEAIDYSLLKKVNITQPYSTNMHKKCIEKWSHIWIWYKLQELMMEEVWSRSTESKIQS